ncbi:RDD family protein [Nocardioides sp.]|uniref:RDD family protein n=1 Tax=Nocardioides sp. TaxID=35761 RepID=UPI002CE0D33B|nr:RDD family protein [Nocardioides sp.]HSX67000.1 RDD family protein [Nocardioides sp.]
MSDAPAGWYPDPTPATAAPSLRYWDGQAWTAHVAPGTQPATHAAHALQQGPTTPDGVPLAGWGIRLAAYLIDLLPIWLLSTLLSIPAQIAMQDEMNRLGEELAETGDMAAFWDGWLETTREAMAWQWPLSLLILAYFVLMLRWKGATVGKLALGLRVRRRDEPGPLPWSTILLRVAAFNGVGFLPVLAFYSGSWAMVVLVLLALTVYVFADVLWPLWDKDRQALHDKVARTNVVKVR